MQCFRFLLTEDANILVFKRNSLVSNLLLTKDANTLGFKRNILVSNLLLTKNANILVFKRNILVSEFLLTKDANILIFKRNILVSEFLLTKDANTLVFKWNVSDFCWQRMQTFWVLNETFLFQIFVFKGISARRSSFLEKDERGPSSIKWALEGFQKQPLGTFLGRGGARMGISELIATILNWTAFSKTTKRIDSDRFPTTLVVIGSLVRASTSLEVSPTVSGFCANVRPNLFSR